MARTPLPRPLGRLRRGRHSLALRWVLVAVAAALAALQASAVAADTEAARDAWGRSVPVVVAGRALAAGDVVGEGDVRVEDRPAAIVPVGALDAPPIGRVVTAPIVAGEAVVGARVAPAGARGVAALVPAGWRALAVPTGGLGAAMPPLAVGDRVDILAPDVVAAGAVVVAVADDAVTVAVPADDAPAVAEAATVAVVVLALRGA